MISLCVIKKQFMCKFRINDLFVFFFSFLIVKKATHDSNRQSLNLRGVNVLSKGKKTDIYFLFKQQLI